MLYVFFWVISQRLNFICRRFGTLCLFHLHRQVGKEWLHLRMVIYVTSCDGDICYILSTYYCSDQYDGLHEHMYKYRLNWCVPYTFLQAWTKIQYSNNVQQVMLDMHTEKKMGLYVNYPLCLPEFYQNWNASTTFHKIIQY